jgi:hypothetical protein
MDHILGEDLYYHLSGQLKLVGSSVDLQTEPITTLATLRLALHEPEPLDVGIVLVANTAHHTVFVHRVDDVRLLFGPLAPRPHLHEEGILKCDCVVQS